MSAASIGRSFGTARRAGQRRGRDAAQIEIELDMTRHAQRRGDLPRRLDLARVRLPVAHGQRMQREAVGANDAAGRVGIQSAAQQE